MNNPDKFESIIDKPLVKFLFQGAGREFYQSTLELQTPICLIEFKLVPIGAIRSKLDRTKNSFVNPFICRAKNNGGEA